MATFKIKAEKKVTDGSGRTATIRFSNQVTEPNVTEKFMPTALAAPAPFGVYFKIKEINLKVWCDRLWFENIGCGFTATFNLDGYVYEIFISNTNLGLISVDEWYCNEDYTNGEDAAHHYAVTEFKKYDMEEKC